MKVQTTCQGATAKRRALRVWSILGAGLVLFSTSAWSQNGFSPCDLNQDGVVNVDDVEIALDMELNLTPCSINILGVTVCDNTLVTAVTNAVFGTACATNVVNPSVSLSWTASTSPDVISYNLYRGAASGGPYTLLTSGITVDGATDNSVQAGTTYYYVVTAVNSSNVESGYSNQAAATVPTT